MSPLPTPEWQNEIEIVTVSRRYKSCHVGRFVATEVGIDEQQVCLLFDAVARNQLDIPPLAEDTGFAFEHSLTNAMGSTAPLSEGVVLAGLVREHEFGDGHFPNQRGTALEAVTHSRDGGRLVSSRDA
jgi:hypothetical protein